MASKTTTSVLVRFLFALIAMALLVPGAAAEGELRTPAQGFDAEFVSPEPQAEPGRQTELSLDSGARDGRGDRTLPEEVILVDFTPEPPSVFSMDLLIAGDSGNASGGMTDLSGGAVAAGGTTNQQTPGDYKAGPGCMVQCITSGIAYARGVNSKLVVKTDTPARIWITVWDNKGYYRFFDSGNTLVTSFGKVFEDLEPGKTYLATAAARDAQGYTSHAHGQFETLTRNVHVSFDHAVLNSSPFNDNHYVAFTRLNGVWLQNGIQTWLGTSVNPDWLVLWTNQTFQNVDRYLGLEVQMQQQEPNCTGVINPVCQAAPAWEPKNQLQGSAGALSWATAVLAAGNNDLDARPSNATSWTEHTLHRTLMIPGAGSLPGGYGAAWDFVVPVTLHVTYD